MPWILSVLGLAGFLAGAYVLFTYGLPAILPFVVALLIAELIEPVVSLLSRRARVPRTVAVILVLSLFIALLTTAAIAGFGKLVQEIEAAIRNLPYLFSLVVDLSERFSEQFGAFHASLPGSIQDLLEANLEQTWENVQVWLNNRLPGLGETLGVVTSLPGLLTNLLISGLATFFMSRDRQVIGGFLLSLFPEPWRPKLRDVKARVWTSAIGYAKAQLMLITLTMVQTMVGLAIIGSHYYVLMGIMVGIADILPIVGPAAVFLPWITYSLILGNKLFGVKLLILYGIVTGVRQLLEPKVVGDQLGLHPLATLFAIYLGIQFFGALGVVIGPLLAILLKAMIQSGLLPIFQEGPRKL